MSVPSSERLNVLGIGIAPLNMDAAVKMIEDWVADDQFGRYVCVVNAHGITEALSDPETRRVLNGANACVPDGMPLSWIGWLRGRKQMNRVYGPDLMLALMERSPGKGYKHYFYGGAPGVAEQLSETMCSMFSGLQVVGTGSPPYRPLTSEEEADLIDEINEAEPDMLWVGVSTPKQDKLMASLGSRVRARVMLGVGAAFDFHTGRVKQAPRWMMRCGLEWLFRFSREPRRLAERYLVGNTRFLFHLFCQSTGLRTYPIDDR